MIGNGQVHRCCICRCIITEIYYDSKERQYCRYHFIKKYGTKQLQSKEDEGK